jgi:predicted ArsR family transcriptional regulator
MVGRYPALSMQTSKQQLIALLKRTGSVTVEEAAGALSVASMTARQHLVGLERDGIVQSEKVRRSMGRPHYLYSLTPKGQEMFPQRYDLFASILLDEIGKLRSSDLEGLEEDEKRSLLIMRTTDQLAERYSYNIEGRTLEQRVSAVSDVLHLIGGFAEWCKTEDGFEIRDYNCVFARLLPLETSGCACHERLLGQLLKWPVRHEVVHAGRADMCRYFVSPNAGPIEGEGLHLHA